MKHISTPFSQNLSDDELPDEKSFAEFDDVFLFLNNTVEFQVSTEIIQRVMGFLSAYCVMETRGENNNAIEILIN
jgi:hypothetical protein